MNKSGKSDETNDLHNDDMPDIIELHDNEKFMDNDGKIIEIEVRGKRDYDNCFFLVDDIMKGFGLIHLKDIITNKRSTYKICVHYKIFHPTLLICPLDISGQNEKKIDSSCQNATKNVFFLTYEGFLKVLFSSHEKTVGKFTKWATKVLFAAQMGTNDQRDELVSNVLGVSISAVKAVFSKTATTIPCIYFLSLGKVKDLRKQLKLDKKYNDDEVVYKYGKTESLARRVDEHKADFSKFSNVDLKLVAYGMIDPQYITKAETKIKHIFESMDITLKHEKYIELVVVPNRKLREVKNTFIDVASKFAGHIEELIQQIKDKNVEIAQLNKQYVTEINQLNKHLVNEITLLNEKHEKSIIIVENNCNMLKKDNDTLKEIAEKNYEILKKDIELSKKDRELLQKENEILKKNNDLLKKEMKLKLDALKRKKARK